MSDGLGSPTHRRWSAHALAGALGLPSPTEEQVRVIELGLGPGLVVAGAGSGKTETMAARVVWLVANQLVEPEAVLGLTFTRKAATELSARIRRRLRGLAALGALDGPGGRRALDGPGGLGVLDGPGGRGVGAAGALGASAQVFTYHGFAGALVKEHGLRLGMEPDARLLSEAASWQLAASVVERWSEDLPSVTAAVTTVVDAVLALSAECAEHLVTVSEVDGWLEHLLQTVDVLPRKVGQPTPGAPYAEVGRALAALRGRRELLPLVRRYAEVKQERGLLDFGDQMALAARLAVSFPDVASEVRERHRVVLLDEFQDTSHAQLLLLSALFGQGHPVTAVGDPHQSIYGWRGASAGALLRFPQLFPPAAHAVEVTSVVTPVVTPEVTPVVTLSTSWRNDAAILAVANAVSAPLRLSATIPPLQPREGAGPGVVLVARTVTEADEATWVASQLRELRQLPDGHRSCAVLCRARSQFPQVVEALRACGLPVQVVGLGGLLSMPEVDDVVALLQVVADPTRGDALIRLLTGPRFRIGPKDLEGLGRMARGLATERPIGGQDVPPDVSVEPHSIVDVLEVLRQSPASGTMLLSPDGRRRLRALAATIAGLRGRMSLTLPELVLECERALDLDIEVAARPGVAADDARIHLDAFVQTAADFDASATAGELATGAQELTAFLAWLEVAVERERGLQPGEVSVDPDAVQVLTVHAAKGLEWDVVAVPGMTEGQFPAAKDADSGWLVGLNSLPYPLRGDAAELPRWRWQEAESQEELRDAFSAFRDDSGEHEIREERRLAYVALTRAREALLLSAPLWSDAKKPKRPSRFLEEVVTAARAGALSGAHIDVWTDDAVPRPEAPRAGTATWPSDPLGERRRDLERVAAAVRAAAEAREEDSDGSPSPLSSALSTSPLSTALPSRWHEDLEALLREREAGAGRSEPSRRLPPSLSVSAVVDYRGNPDSFLRDLRRPVPRRPVSGARRGTSFHAWVEQHYSDPALLDLEEIEELLPEPELERLKQTFLASEWATRLPLGVEVPFETPVGGTVVRGRIDAVFPVPGAGNEVEIVDWKTGSRRDDEKAHVAQLALYRLAWSRLHGVSPEAVRVALYYAATGETWRPSLLPDVRELEELLATDGQS